MFTLDSLSVGRCSVANQRDAIAATKLIKDYFTESLNTRIAAD